MKYGSDNLLARRSNKGVSADARIEQRQYLTTPGLNPSVTSVPSVAKIITVLTRLNPRLMKPKEKPKIPSTFNTRYQGLFFYLRFLNMD